MNDHKGPLWAEHDGLGWWRVRAPDDGHGYPVACYCTESDAHLFAAAQELLAAAKDALILLEAHGWPVHPNNVAGALQAAISKATPGEET